ncbi:MAG: hypothetical protein AB1509_18220 [Chloroflexota bacterium]
MFEKQGEMFGPFVLSNSQLGMPRIPAALLSATFQASFALSYQQFFRFFDTNFASVKSPDVVLQAGGFGLCVRQPSLTFPVATSADLPAGA